MRPKQSHALTAGCFPSPMETRQVNEMMTAWLCASAYVYAVAWHGAEFCTLQLQPFCSSGGSPARRMTKSLPAAEEVFDFAKDNKRNLCVFCFRFTKAIACAAPVTGLIWRALIRRRTNDFLRVLLRSPWLRSDKGKALANYKACLEVKRSIYMVLPR